MNRPSYILSLLLVGTVACNTDDGLEPVDAGTQQSELIEERFGTVLAEYHGGGTAIHAQFIDARGITIDSAERALEVWSPDTELDVDACTVRAEPLPNADAMRLRLLDAGPIRLTGADSRIELEGRRLPDFSSSVSGVVYGNEEGFELDRAELTYDPFERYRITAEGSDEMGGFTVWLIAPDVPRLASVEETLPVRDELALEWDGSGASSYTELYLDVRGKSTGPESPRLTCRLEDDGRFALPRAIFEQLGSTKFDVALRRVHRVRADVQGLEGADFVFAATDARDAELER